VLLGQGVRAKNRKDPIVSRKEVVFLNIGSQAASFLGENHVSTISKEINKGYIL